MGNQKSIPQPDSVSWTQIQTLWQKVKVAYSSRSDWSGVKLDDTLVEKLFRFYKADMKSMRKAHYVGYDHNFYNYEEPFMKLLEVFQSPK